MLKGKLDSRFRTTILGVIFAALVWGFQAMIFRHAPGVFSSPSEDMSFAYFVPLFSLYVVYTERRRIADSVGNSSFWGLIAILPLLALGILGVRGIQLRLEILAFVGLLVAVPWALFGARTARAVLFPAAFLLFCIPLATFLDVVTVHLRLLATAVSEAILTGCGVQVVRQGSMLAAADGAFSIDVAEPCSGLRSIFALMALTAGYAYFTQPTFWRRILLFSFSVPLAILGNVARILTICIVASFASEKFALGFYHDYSGYVVFLVAISLMVGVGELISRLAARVPQAAAPKAPLAASACPANGCWRNQIVPAAALLVVLPVMVFQACTPQAELAEARKPNLAALAFNGYWRTNIEPSEAERTVLPKDTLVEKVRFDSDDGDWFVVTAVVGGASKSSIHRPELCLPAQGCLMTAPRTRNVGGMDWRFITLVHKDAQPQGFAYAFFNQAGFRTASHTRRILRDVWDRSVLNRIDRWVMVTVNAARVDDASLSAIAGALENLCK